MRKHPGRIITFPEIGYIVSKRFPRVRRIRIVSKQEVEASRIDMDAWGPVYGPGGKIETVAPAAGEETGTFNLGGGFEVFVTVECYGEPRRVDRRVVDWTPKFFSSPPQ